MAVKKRGLGRGLDALLGGARPASAPLHEGQEVDVATQAPGQASAAPAGEPASPGHDGDLKNVPIEFIQPGRYQPRLDLHPEKLEELASSIRAQGVMQPIVVRP